MPNNQAGQPENIPSELYGYKVTKFLGVGGMSLVYRIIDDGQKRNLAIKIPRSLKKMSQAQQQRFILEAKITGQLQHPSIPPVYDISEIPEKMYYTMKLIRGLDLGGILKEIKNGNTEIMEKYSRRHLLNIFVRVCQAIAFCHSRGVIHRDIKPENIMLGEFGEIQIIDFGLAKAFGKNLYTGETNDEIPEAFDSDSLLFESSKTESIFTKDISDSNEDEISLESQTIISQSTANLTKAGKLMGTILYMAPEQAQGEVKLHNQTSDTYALGAILWKILIGENMRQATNLQDYLKIAISGQRPNIYQKKSNKRLEPDITDILIKATAPQQKYRFQSAGDLAHEIQEYLDGKRKWRLAYQTTFKNTEDSNDTPSGWTSHLGNWSIKDGALISKSDGNVIHLDQDFEGDLRLEITANIDKIDGEIAPIIKAPKKPIFEFRTDGYCLEYGADSGQHSKLSRNEHDISFNSTPVKNWQEKKTIVVELLNGVLRMECNGKEILQYRDFFPLKGSRIGFYSWCAGMKIYDLTVYLAGTPREIDYIAIPDSLFESKAFEQALFEYTKIQESFPGSEQAEEALYKSILCLIELKKQEEAILSIEKLKNTLMCPLAFVALSRLEELNSNASNECKSFQKEKEILTTGLKRTIGFHKGKEDFLLRYQLRAKEFSNKKYFDLSTELWELLSNTTWVGQDQKANALRQLAATYERAGQFEKALIIGENLDPSIFSTVHGKNIYTCAKQSAELCGLYKRARALRRERITKKCGNIPIIDWDIGTSYYRECQFKKSIDHYQQCLSKYNYPTNQDLYKKEIIRSYINDEFFSKAKMIIKEELNKQNLPSTLYFTLNYYLGLTCYQIGQLKEAKEILNNQFKKVQPIQFENYANIMFNLLISNKNHSEAKNFCNKVQNYLLKNHFEFRNISIQHWKATIHYYQKEYLLAQDIYNSSIKNSKDGDIKIGWAWLGLIRLERNNNNIEKALDLCRQALNKSPSLHVSFFIAVWENLLSESIANSDEQFQWKNNLHHLINRKTSYQWYLYAELLNSNPLQWQQDERNITLDPIEVLRRVGFESRRALQEMIDFKATYNNHWLPYASDKNDLLTSTEANQHYLELKKLKDQGAFNV